MCVPGNHQRQVPGWVASPRLQSRPLSRVTGGLVQLRVRWGPPAPAWAWPAGAWIFLCPRGGRASDASCFQVFVRSAV